MSLSYQLQILWYQVRVLLYVRHLGKHILFAGRADVLSWMGTAFKS